VSGGAWVADHVGRLGRAVIVLIAGSVFYVIWAAMSSSVADDGRATATFVSSLHDHPARWTAVLVVVGALCVWSWLSEDVSTGLRRWALRVGGLVTATDQERHEKLLMGKAMGARAVKDLNEAAPFVIPVNRATVKALRELPPGVLSRAVVTNADGSWPVRARAVARYVQLRIDHSVAASRAAAVYWTVQFFATVLAAATPILFLFSSYPIVFKVVPAVVGVLLTSIGGIADWRAAARNQRGAASAMDNEYVRLDHGLDGYGEDDAASIKRFVTRIVEIRESAGGAGWLLGPLGVGDSTKRGHMLSHSTE